MGASTKFVRLNPLDHARLKEISAQTRRPIQALVQSAVLSFLDRKEK